MKKINAPLVCRFDDQELSFDDGKDLAKYRFDKKYEVDSILMECGHIIVNLKECLVRVSALLVRSLLQQKIGSRSIKRGLV